MNIESVISENINSFHKNIFTPPNLKKNSYNIDSFLNNRSGSNMSHQRSPFAIQELLGLGPGGDSAGTPPQHRGPTTGVHTPGGHNIGSCGELNKIFTNIYKYLSLLLRCIRSFCFDLDLFCRLHKFYVALLLNFPTEKLCKFHFPVGHR